MKITRRQLRQIIKEEISIISEGPAPDLVIEFEFKRGKSGRKDAIVIHPTSFPNPTQISDAVARALTSDRKGFKPIKVKAGTSGSGTREQNEIVLNNRIKMAFKFLFDVATAEGNTGPNDFITWNPASLMNIADINYNINLIKPGQRVEISPGVYGDVPSNPDNPFFVDFQFVEITLRDPGIGADPVTLANEFVEATLRTKGPVYADTPAGQLKVSNNVADILSQLRNASEFEAFNDTVVKLNRSKKDFYGIAATATFNIPKLFGKHLGGGKSLGPREIPAGVTEINRELKRLGQEPLS